MLLTYKYRIKDRRARKGLQNYARAVNQVWNYCVSHQRDIEARHRAGAPKRKWPSCFDLHKLTAGTSKELGVHAGSIHETCRFFVEARNRHQRAPRFRASAGPRRALGWIPFQTANRRLRDNIITYLGKDYRVWLGGRPFPEQGVRGGAFVEDSLGRWYVCLVVDVAANDKPASAAAIGIDLGLKAIATCSDGRIVEAHHAFRRHEERLAVAQRSGNRRRAKAIHAKIANCRKDFLHKTTTQIARENALIAVGNVSSSRLAKTRMAKSVLDAGWSMFRSQLRYKASRHGAVYLDVDERFTTQACSCCGAVPHSSPKGMGALGIRAWDCSDCGASHDRDVNAARNILTLALSAQRPGGESRQIVTAGNSRISPSCVSHSL